MVSTVGLRELPRRIGRFASSWIVAAPCTHIYLLVLLVTTETVRSLHPVLASQLLRQVSTNLNEMGRSAGRVLFLSAFLLDDGQWGKQVVLFTLVYVPLERWAGSLRWLSVVIAGHVGATIATTVGIWADARSNRGTFELTHSIDVGVSYGFFAAAAFLTFGLRRRWIRATSLAVLFAALVGALLDHHTFTNAGHVAALCIGVAMYLVLSPGLRNRPSVSTGSRSRSLLRSSGASPGPSGTG